MGQFVVLDCATGGKYSDVHSLLAISAIRVTASFERMESFHVKILHPTFSVTSEALQKNHIDLMNPTGFVPAADAKRALFRFLGCTSDQAEHLCHGKVTGRFSRLTITGMNISYDIPFLKKFMGENVYDTLFDWRPFDVLSSFENLYSCGVVREPKTTGMTGLAGALGIDVNPERIHEPKYAVDITCKIARIIYKKGEAVGKLVAEHGQDYPGLLDDSVAVTRIKPLQNSRKRIVRELEDEEDLTGQ